MKTMNTSKKIAILLIITILLQLFSPYGVLINSTQATGAVDQLPEYKHLVLTIDKCEDAYLDYEDYGIAHMQLVLRGDVNFSGMDVCFSYDSNILVPTYNAGTARRPDYVEATNMEDWDITTTNFGSDISENNTWLFSSQNKFRLEGTAAVDKNPESTKDKEVVIGELYFLLKDGYDLDNIPTSAFTLTPAAGITTGMTLVYDTYYSLSDSMYYGMEGFLATAKQVQSIAVKTNPTNTIYDHGDIINLTGGVITVTYDDNSTEDVNMSDPKVSIVTGSPAHINVTNVTISYEGKQTSFPITVNDPIDKLEVKTPMTRVEYDHGNNIQFDGLTLLATKRSGGTETLYYNSPGVTTSETLASINSSNFTQSSPASEIIVSGTQKIKFTYEGKEAETTIIVNDTISKVEVVNQPNKKVYKRDENLDLSGAKVKVTLGSGGTSTINLPDGSVAVSNFNNTLTGSTQRLSVSFGGTTATETIDVEVYNYVTDISLTAPTNRRPDYNTELDLSGGSITEYWKDGNVVNNIALTPSMISGYNKMQKGQQTVTVRYEVTYTLSDGTEITDTFTKNFTVNVQNTAKSIVITAPSKTIYNHGEGLVLTRRKHKSNLSRQFNEKCNNDNYNDNRKSVEL